MAPLAATSGAMDTFNQRMIESIRNHHFQEMARIFVEETCPGDWNGGWNVAYGNILRNCAKGERPNKLPNPDGWHEDIEIMASIQFRWQIGLITDHIIKTYGLPVPGEKACLFWHRMTWEQEIERRIPSWRDRKTKISEKLRLGGFILQPRPEQGPVWARPWQYLSSAIVQADLPEQETMNLINKILSFMRQVGESDDQCFIPDFIKSLLSE